MSRYLCARVCARASERRECARASERRECAGELMSEAVPQGDVVLKEAPGQMRQHAKARELGEEEHPQELQHHARQPDLRCTVL